MAAMTSETELGKGSKAHPTKNDVSGLGNPEIRPVSDSPELRDEAAVVEEEENNKIQEAVGAFIRKGLKWTHRELHDALLVAGVAVPSVPSIRNYVAALHTQFGNAGAGFLPQSFRSHTQDKLQRNLRILVARA